MKLRHGDDKYLRNAKIERPSLRMRRASTVNLKNRRRRQEIIRELVFSSERTDSDVFFVLKVSKTEKMSLRYILSMIPGLKANIIAVPRVRHQRTYAEIKKSLTKIIFWILKDKEASSDPFTVEGVSDREK